jgi:hypothetical protein
MLSQGLVGASALSGAAMVDNGFFVVPEGNWNASDTGFSLVGDVPFAASVAAAAAPVLALLPEQIKPGKVTWQGRQIEILADTDKRNPGKAPTTDKGVWIIDPDGPLKTFSPQIAATMPSFLRIQDLTDQNYISPDKRVTKVIDSGPGTLELPAWMRDPAAQPGTGTNTVGKTLTKLYSDRVVIDGPKENVLSIQEIEARIRNSENNYDPSKINAATYAPQEQIVGIADFNGDQSRDILIQNKQTQELTIWYMNGVNKIGEAPIVSVIPGVSAIAGSGYEVAGVGDFNSDGQADIVWRNPSAVGSGTATVCWYLNGNQFTGGGAFPVFGGVGAGWDLRVADFNNDGKADLLWQNVSTNQTLFWYMNGLNAINPSVPGGSYAFLPSLPSPASNWRMIGAGRIDGDTIPDVFMHNLVTGAVQGWLISSSNVPNQVNATLQSVIQQNSNNPQLVPASDFLGTTVGDLDGNGKADIFWKYKVGLGNHVLWSMSATNGLKIDPNPTQSGIAPLNYASSTRGNYVTGTFHSGYGYGGIDVTAAIRQLTGQNFLEITDPAPGSNIQFNSTRQNEMINAPEAWNAGFIGTGQVVAVIDSGVQVNHPDLDANIAPGGRNFALNNNDVSDSDTHGTAVAGMIARAISFLSRP